jgi:hypothetical protein
VHDAAWRAGLRVERSLLNRDVRAARVRRLGRRLLENAAHAGSTFDRTEALRRPDRGGLPAVQIGVGKGLCHRGLTRVGRQGLSRSLACDVSLRPRWW